MAQEGRGKQPSLPESIFEIDEFDKNWDGDPPSGLELMREPSVLPQEPLSEPDSEVQASSRRQWQEEPSSPYPDDLVVEPEIEGALPLVLPDSDSSESPAQKVTPLSSRRPASEAAVARLARAAGMASGSERTTAPGDPLLNEVRDRYAMGDYSGALTITEGILANDPEHAQALRYADNCRQVLEQMYCAKIGPLTQRPEVAVSGDQLRWLTLDHRAGFLLSLVDGGSSVEELLDISGMPRFEALRTLCDLLEQNVITLAR